MLLEDVFICLAKSFLEWEGFEQKLQRKVRTHILCSIPFFSSEILAGFEIM